MPTYTVTCTHATSAADYPVDVTAPSPREALAKLQAAGHIVGEIRLSNTSPAGWPEPSSPVDATLVELRAINANLLALRADGAALRQARAVRAPIGTVATAVLIAFACWTFVCAACFFGILVWSKGRPTIYDPPAVRGR